VSPRPWHKRIDDILSSARNIEKFTVDLSFETFLNDPKSIRAVAFEFITIGEAARAVPDEIKENHPEIPWGQMQGIRNVLVHEYFRLDEEILWNASRQDIPLLIAALENLK
jgi:uncharacterized protein with HEPN domain